jgi:transcriptional regulator with XRE-family HTH domain
MLQGEAGLTTTHEKLGIRIKELRKKLGMTQEDLAFQVGVDRSYMGFVERGEKNPTLAKLTKIAKSLKVSLALLFENN